MLRNLRMVRHPYVMPIIDLWLVDENGDVEVCLLPGMNDGLSTNYGRLSMDGMQAQNWTLVVAMPLAESSLRELLKAHKHAGRPGIPRPELLAHLEQMASGLDYLHSPRHNVDGIRQSIQHLDIKPANIMLVGGRVRISDFGLATSFSGDWAATSSHFVGSLAYMPPEIATTRKASFASDQYSLAVTIYELLVGELPYPDQSVVGMLGCVERAALDFSKVTRAERRVLRRATSLDPTKRYPTASEMVICLRRAFESAQCTESGLTPPRAANCQQTQTTAIHAAMTVVCETRADRLDSTVVLESRDRQVVDRAVFHNRDWLEKMLLQRYDWLRSVARNSMKEVLRDGRTEVDDVLQEAFVRILRGFAKFSPRSADSLFQGLKTIVQNTARDAVRKRHGSREVVLADAHQTRSADTNDCDILAELAVDHRSTLVESQRKELMRAFRTAVSNLAPAYQQVIDLLYVQQYSVEHMAQIMQTTSASVRGLRRRARRKIQAALIRLSNFV